MILISNCFLFNIGLKDFEGLYKEEKRTRKISLIFSIVAVVLAGLGLYGLTTFKIEQRRKEISLRKVMGAEIEHIVFYLSKEVLEGTLKKQ